MWDLKIDTRRLVEGFSTSVLWERPNILWNKADDWWNDNYVTDPSTAAFLSATGIIDPNKQNYVNNLVIALKNQGLWNKMKAIYPFVSEQRNLLNNTEDFSTTDWVKAGATITSNDALAPNGTMTADKVVFGTSNNYIYQTVTTATGTCTHSIYVKGTAGETISLDDLFTYIPLVTLTGSWQRVSWTSTNNSPHGLVVSSAQGATARTIWLWGAQLELGTAPTDYQTTINAQEQFAAAYKYNLKDPQDTDAAFRLKIFGTWTFTPTGAKPNGTNAYMDTILPSNTMANGSTHMCYYSRTNQTSNDPIEMGTEPPDFLLWFNAFSLTRANFGSVMDYSPTLTDTRGFLLASRYSTTNGLIQFNSSQQLKTGLSGDSRGTKNIFIGATNRTGTSAANFSAKECAFASIGDGLLDSEASALYTIVQQFQTSMLRQV